MSMMKNFSVIQQLRFALVGIVLLAVSTMLLSCWLSQQAKDDALAMNIAGSLRMQTYKVALLQQQADPAAAALAQQQLLSSWQHPVFYQLKHQDAKLSELFRQARYQWLVLAGKLSQQLLSNEELVSQLNQQVDLIEQLVSQVQQGAESRLAVLRWVQLSAVLLLAGVAVIVYRGLQQRVVQPLQALTQVAKQITQGDLSARLQLPQQDEFGLLALTLDQMSTVLASRYGSLAQQLADQNDTLARHHQQLQFLYQLSQRFIHQQAGSAQLKQLLNDLQQLVAVAELELCLMTENGVEPYLQLKTELCQTSHCQQRDCQQCRQAPAIGLREKDNLVWRFQLQREYRHFGILLARTAPEQPLTDWQQQLLAAVAAQLALALSLQQQQDQSCRLALLQERNLIAGELHHALAQSLSYLKIQTNRLQKCLARQDQTCLLDVATELSQSLDVAYRQFYQLLSTFSLTISGGGLEQALQHSLHQLAQQSGIRFELHYQLLNIPLHGHEEIHLLQLVKECCQLLVQQSLASEVVVTLQQVSDQLLELSISDNGVGTVHSQQLLVLQDRAQQLRAQLQTQQTSQGRYLLTCRFIPQSLLHTEPKCTEAEV